MLNRKKTVISGVMAAMLVMGVASPAFAAETANPTSSTIYVDGQEVAFEAYNINGNNYFKLRDIAWALSGTDAQFNVTWDNDEQVINLVSGEDYGKNGSLSVGNGKVKSATLNTAPIMKDGSYVDMTAYNIEGNNFFKLRDLGEQFDFAVGWNGDANAVTINTDGMVEEKQEEQEVTGTSWYEGGKHGIPKAGDTVIKADGTKVVLKSTNIAGYEILAYGQGVDAITGTTINGVTITKGGAFGAWSGYGAGNDRSAFAYDPISGETHTQNEWAAIASNYPEKAGSYDGEIANTYYKWHAGGERWMWMGPKF